MSKIFSMQTGVRMLDSRGIEQKLYNLAAVFNVHMKAKRYPQAKYCYDKARGLAVEVELEQEKKDQLFGIRGNRGEIVKEGLFKEEMVMKAYVETCVKAKQEPEDCRLCGERIWGEV